MRVPDPAPCRTPSTVVGMCPLACSRELSGWRTPRYFFLLAGCVFPPVVFAMITILFLPSGCVSRIWTWQPPWTQKALPHRMASFFASLWHAPCRMAFVTPLNSRSGNLTAGRVAPSLGRISLFRYAIRRPLNFDGT